MAPASNTQILIVKLDELGDVLMSLPLVASIKEHHPNWKITMLVNEATEGIVGGSEDVSVIPLDVKCHKYLRPIVLPIRYFLFARKHLKIGFDICFVPRRDVDSVYSVLVAYFANASRRISFTEKSTALKARVNKGFDCLLTDVVPEPPPMQHETASNLTLLSSIGLQNVSVSAWLPVSRPAEEFAARVLARVKWPLIALCPSSGNSELKQWGAERMAELAQRLAAKHCSVVLVGSTADTALGKIIEDAKVENMLNLIGKTSLSQLASVLRRCAMFIGNDAGPAHLASALQIPTVAVFGSSCYHRFGPWSPQSLVQVREVPCSPCVSHAFDRCKSCPHSTRICLDAVSVEQVFQAALSLLPKSHGASW